MNMGVLAVLVIVLWMVVMTLLLSPPRMYKNAWDRVTKARWNKDKVQLQIMLDNLRTKPELWSISRDGASYPLEGAKQVYLNFDKDKGWEYSLSSSGGGARPLEGHFGKEISQEILQEHSRRESRALLRTFYPELDGTLLLK